MESLLTYATQASTMTGLTILATLAHFIAENGTLVPPNFNFANILYFGEPGQFGALPWHKGAKLPDTALASGARILQYVDAAAGLAAYAALVNSASMSVIKLVANMTWIGEGKTQAELAAIALSPWDEGHYTDQVFGDKLGTAYQAAQTLLAAESPASTSLPGSMPFVLESAILMHVDINGTAYLGILDTGSSAPLLLGSKQATQLGLSPIGPGVEVGGVTGSTTGYESPVRLTVAGVTLPTITAVIDPAHTAYPLIGLPVLQQLAPIFTVDFRQKLLSFVAPITSVSAVSPVIGDTLTEQAIRTTLGTLSWAWRNASEDVLARAVMHLLSDYLRQVAVGQKLGVTIQGPNGYLLLRLPDGTEV